MLVSKPSRLEIWMYSKFQPESLANITVLRRGVQLKTCNNGAKLPRDYPDSSMPREKGSFRRNQLSWHMVAAEGIGRDGNLWWTQQAQAVPQGK